MKRIEILPFLTRTLLVTCICTLTGCGQRGALYLPDSQSTQASPAVNEEAINADTAGQNAQQEVEDQESKDNEASN